MWYLSGWEKVKTSINNFTVQTYLLDKPYLTAFDIGL